MYLTSAVRAEC